MLNLSDCINTRNDTIRDDVHNFLKSSPKVANGSFPTHSLFAALINKKTTTHILDIRCIILLCLLLQFKYISISLIHLNVKIVLGMLLFYVHTFLHLKVLWFSAFNFRNSHLKSKLEKGELWSKIWKVYGSEGQDKLKRNRHKDVNALTCLGCGWRSKNS